MLYTRISQSSKRISVSTELLLTIELLVLSSIMTEYHFCRSKLLNPVSPAAGWFLIWFSLITKSYKSRNRSTDLLQSIQESKIFSATSGFFCAAFIIPSKQDAMLVHCERCISSSAFKSSAHVRHIKIAKEIQQLADYTKCKTSCKTQLSSIVHKFNNRLQTISYKIEHCYIIIFNNVLCIQRGRNASQNPNQSILLCS